MGKSERKTQIRHAAAAACALAVLLLLPFSGAAAAKQVDLNTANVEELLELPGIGPAKAQAIVEERNKARFRSVDDLERVKGIGAGLMAELREHVTVSSAEAQ